MGEVREGLTETLNTACKWVCKELLKEKMSPEATKIIPETLKAINELANTLRNPNVR